MNICFLCSSISNCVTCLDGPVCSTCITGHARNHSLRNLWFISEYSACISCASMPNCATCQDGPVCATCLPGFFLDFANCKSSIIFSQSFLSSMFIHSKLSKLCQRSSLYCLHYRIRSRLYFSYFFLNKVNKTCKTCSAVFKCVQCTNGPTCTQCEKGFYLNSTSK